jgi:hypothetical protein
MYPEIEEGIKKSKNGEDENAVIELKRKGILSRLAPCELLPSNGVPFLIDSKYPEKFDFKKVEINKAS